MLNHVKYIAFVDGRFFNLGEFPTPLVVLERLTGRAIGIGETPNTFPVLGWPIECWNGGIRMPARRPATRLLDVGTLWWPPHAWADLPLTGWTDWIEAMEANGLPRAAITTATGMAAISCWVNFNNWAAPKAAEQAIQILENGGGTIAELNDVIPAIEHVGAYRDYVADRALAGALPKKRQGQRGKKLEIRRAVLELFALACVLYREQPAMSWANAYEAACNERPEWVPSSWMDGDNGGRLGKEAAKLKGTRWWSWRGSTTS